MKTKLFEILLAVSELAIMLAACSSGGGGGGGIVPDPGEYKMKSAG